MGKKTEGSQRQETSSGGGGESDDSGDGQGKGSADNNDSIAKEFIKNNHAVKDRMGSMAVSLDQEALRLIAELFLSKH